MLNNKKTQIDAWESLEKHQNAIRDIKIADLFKDDMGRTRAFSVHHENLEFDFSKHKLTEQTVTLLCDLAKEKGLENKREQLFNGQNINISEQRPALHMALRGSVPPLLEINGLNVKDQVDQSLAKIEQFTNSARDSKKYTHIVNIGIGGSDFGPYMVCKALRHLRNLDINRLFLSNIDAAHIAHYMKFIDPHKTLFIVSSKSFTTQETITNAQSVKNWLKNEHGITDISDNFCAVTNNEEEALRFGIKPDMIFHVPEWVGGRFSLWSSVGLSIALSVGFENFKSLLEGAHSADQHFMHAPMERNIPVLMGLIGIWYRNFWDYACHAVLPYSQNMSQLPQYIQQLEMESNGKSIDIDGKPVSYKTAPVILGGIGSNAQHTFFQLLHQGSDIIPCDFIAVRKPVYEIGDHHEKLIANVIGQTKALMTGQKNDSEPHRSFEGNRPTSTLWIDELTPYSLGMLLAFYEHKVFVQGAIWNINSFDQFGVELGKELADEALRNIQNS